MILAAMNEMQQGMVVLLMVFCAITITLMLLRRRQFRNVTGRDMVREQLARLRDQKEIRGSLEELLLQLEDVSRRVNAQLDTKFGRLETVVRDADDRIARLEALRDDRSGEGKNSDAPVKPGVSTSTAPAEPPASSAKATSFVDRLPKLERAAIGRRSAAPDAGRAAGKPRPPSPRANSKSPDPEPLKPEHKRVYDLVDAGSAPIRIAESLGMSLGEVELILNLRSYR